MSGHGKKQTERDALTNWRQQCERLVRTQIETDRARLTHVLDMAEGRTCQDTERNRLSKSHSHPGRRQREGLVMTRKETDQARRTHSLEAAEGGICRDTERNQASREHSLSGDGRRMALSGYRKKLPERGTLTSWRWQWEVLVRTQKEIDRARRTHVLEMAEGLVRTQKETD